MILVITNSTHSFACTFISILYMFRAAMCPSSGELLYQCDTWCMSPCVEDRLVRRLNRITDGRLHCPKHVLNRNKRTKNLWVQLFICKEYKSYFVTNIQTFKAL